MISTKRLTLLLLALASLSFFGCAGPAEPEKKTAEVDANGNPIEYVWYTPTGSSIPKRVPKSSVTPSEADATRAQNSLSERQRSGNTQNPAGS